MALDKKHDEVICVDFDGVISDYKDGWQGPYLFGPPIEGAFEFIDALLTRGYKVRVFTARAQWPNMDRAIRDWMIDNGLPAALVSQLEVDNVKCPAKLYIDDRAFAFNGTWPSMKFVDSFEPWHKGGN